MAGIIVDVSSDIQKLQKLKAEIASVKQELKGIDIRVNLDIKENIEVRLQSLMKQYNALVTKIAEAEGKILLSTKRINDASEKIIQAQEKVSKATIIPTQTGNTNLQGANTTETASIQAQAKAYDDLKNEINDILGTRDANVKRMVEEMNAIRLINAEIKKITKSQGESSSLSSAQQKRLEQLNNSLLTHKTVLSEVRQTLSNNVRLDNAAATSMNGLSQSLSRMRIAYRELTEEERNSPIGKELLVSINQADAKIKELDATIGNHMRNVGNYGKQWNGLSMSIQQVGRELPSLAYGPKVFFSAISNNLPILADEIKRARTEYELLKKSGQSATPVWKQVISSLFSWQSALTVGITLLTLYGDKIVDWVSGLFSTKDAIIQLLTAEQEMALARKNAAESIKKEQTELDILYSKLKNASSSTKDRTSAANEWIKRYPEYANILNGENINLGKLETAYKALSKEIYASAVARQYADRLADLSVKRENEEIKRLNQKLTVSRAEQEYERLSAEYKKKSEQGFGSATAKLAAENKIELARRNIETQKKLYDDIVNNVKSYDKNITIIENHIKTADLFPQPKEGTYDYWQQQVQNADIALKQIDSKLKDRLDKAFDSGNNLYDLGIDESIVASYKQARKLKSEAEKALKVYEDPSKQESAAEKLRQQQEKYNLLLDKQKLDRIRREEDLQMQVDETTINAMDEGSKKTIAQMQHNFKKEMQAIDRQKEDALRKKIEDARSAWEADPKNKKKSFDATGIKLSDEENKKYDALYKAQTESFEKEKLRTEASAMREYLKEYGTFQQQKLAIAEEYAEKIKNAQFESERLTLGKQRDAALLNTDVQAAKQDIDWQSVFGDLGMMLKEQIQPTIDNLKTVIQSKEFQNSSIEDQQKIYDLLSDLEKQSGTFGKDMFKDVSRDLQLFRNSLNAYNEAKQREVKAANDLATAQERLKKAQEIGDDTTSAQQAVDDAQVIFNQASESVRTFSDKVNENAENLHNSSEKARGAIEGLAGGLNKLKSGSLQQAFEGVKDIGASLGGKIGDMIANIDPTGIISGVLGLLDVLKDGLSSIFVSLQDTMYGAIEGILNDVFSGDIIMKPLENSVKHMGSILDTITFGGFSSWLGLGDSDKNLERDLEYLTQSNQDLKNSLDSLSEKMDKASVAESNDIYKVQKENLEKQESNTREAMQRSGAASKDGFIFGGEHSSNYRIDKGISASEWGRVSEIVGRSVQNAGQFFQLSSEQMAKLAEEDTTLYSKIKDLADNGYKDAAQYMDEYITYYKQLEELENAHNEKLTNTSFDSIRNDFKNALLDMESDAEDFTNNFEKMMQNAIVESLMTKKYDALIQAWYEDFAKAMEGDGKVDENEQRDLKKQWGDIVNKGIADRDALKNAMGWETEDSSREASAKGIATASQESVDENNGRLTVIQEHTFNLNENVTRIATGIDSIVNHTANLSCLTNIDKTMQSLLTMREQTITHLANIDNHTSNLVEMRNDMHSMKQDINTMLIKGLKLSKN